VISGPIPSPGRTMMSMKAASAGLGMTPGRRGADHRPSASRPQAASDASADRRDQKT
jgi:hypothetical protein